MKKYFLMVIVSILMMYGVFLYTVYFKGGE